MSCKFFSVLVYGVNTVLVLCIALVCLYVTGPKELKVLVDLAMISATGQGDLEVQKVSCLHAAATGYAPLIYDMKRDMGFKEFLPLCQAVWRSLDVDDKLPEKFVCISLCLCKLPNFET